MYVYKTYYSRHTSVEWHAILAAYLSIHILWHHLCFLQWVSWNGMFVSGNCGYHCVKYNLVQCHC